MASLTFNVPTNMEEPGFLSRRFNEGYFGAQRSTHQKTSESEELAVNSATGTYEFFSYWQELETGYFEIVREEASSENEASLYWGLSQFTVKDGPGENANTLKELTGSFQTREHRHNIYGGAKPDIGAISTRFDAEHEPYIFADLLKEDDTINGSKGNDKLYGFAGDDTLFSNGGNDYLNGGHGFDKAVINGDFSDYISRVISPSSIELRGNSRSLILEDIEAIEFLDGQSHAVANLNPWMPSTLGKNILDLSQEPARIWIRTEALDATEFQSGSLTFSNASAPNEQVYVYLGESQSSMAT